LELIPNHLKYRINSQSTLENAIIINSQYVEVICDQFGIDSELIEASNWHQPFKEKSGKQKIRYSINKYIQSYVFCIYDN
jgi:hypothetical protein